MTWISRVCIPTGACIGMATTAITSAPTAAHRANPITETTSSSTPTTLPALPVREAKYLRTIAVLAPAPRASKVSWEWQGTNSDRKQFIARSRPPELRNPVYQNTGIGVVLMVPNSNSGYQPPTCPAQFPIMTASRPSS
eukprot:8556461-Pyramimonas_sp.AAC.1